MKEKLTTVKQDQPKKPYTKPEAKVTKISLGVWAGSCSGSCLSPSTKIDTPYGPKAISKLNTGDKVYTLNDQGDKVSARIIEKSKIHVSKLHQMIHLGMMDDRILIVSPDHPTNDSRTVRELFPKEKYNDSSINTVKLIAYDHSYTYDILPEGKTGYYWANGILIGSTLTKTHLPSLVNTFSSVELVSI